MQTGSLPVVFVVALDDGAGAVRLAALDNVGLLGVDLQDPLLPVLVLHAAHPHILQRYDTLHSKAFIHSLIIIRKPVLRIRIQDPVPF